MATVSAQELEILKQVQGLRQIIVSDRDGVVIFRIPSEDSIEPSLAPSSSCHAAFSIAADQVGFSIFRIENPTVMQVTTCMCLSNRYSMAPFCRCLYQKDAQESW